MVAKQAGTAEGETEHVHTCKTNRNYKVIPPGPRQSDPARSKADETKNAAVSPVSAQPQRQKLFNELIVTLNS